MGFGFDLMFFIAPIIIGAGFVLVFVLMAVTVVRMISEWNKNNHSPRLDAAATVVTKRTSVSRHHHNHHGHRHTTASTFYYATFQFDSGDRLELSVSGQDYGMLAEGDRETLTFQGTRFLGFKRGMP